MKLTLGEKEKIEEINNPYPFSALVFEELAQFKEIYQAEAHHDLIGHMLTFSHALNILYDLGHTDYFQKGLPSFLKLVKVLRVSREGSGSSTKKLISPVDRYPLIKAARSDYLPIKAEFWKQHFTTSDWDFGHVFKFPFSFYNHLNRLTSVPGQAAENFCYILSSG